MAGCHAGSEMLNDTHLEIQNKENGEGTMGNKMITKETITVMKCWYPVLDMIGHNRQNIPFFFFLFINTIHY